MDEDSFWVKLEISVCREFAGLSERRHRQFWCDGFVPGQYLLEGHRPRITGKAWICVGSVQNEWDFALLLHRRFGSREEVDWASLLPPEDMTRWMAFDEARRYIEIEPAVAVPDLC